MTKTELIALMAEKYGMTKTMAAKAVTAMTEIIADALAEGKKVTLTGFGTFMVRPRAARMGRNPRTQAPMKIPATRTPAFRAGKSLRDRVKA